jgi:hypothetical protein
MNGIADRARDIRARIRAEVHGEKKVPAPVPLPSRRAVDSTALVLGRNHRDEVVTCARAARLQHAHVIGTVGSGESKFLEHCIRQDIAAGLGVCVIDPHGHRPDSLFRSLLSWIGEGSRAKSRPVHVIDQRRHAPDRLQSACPAVAAHGDFRGG